MAELSFFERMKRTIVMSTVFLQLDSDMNAEEAAIARCNRELNLVKDLNGLRLPYRMKDLIWSDKQLIDDVVSLLKQGHVNQATDLLLNRLPRFARYRRCNMRRDLRMVLNRYLPRDYSIT